MVRPLIILALSVLSCGKGTDQEAKQPVDYINPFIGASTSVEKAGINHGLGKTFPGAATPSGMVQLSPNTITGGDNGSGYSHEHTSIEGFAFTQMSGVGWGGDLGNFLVMPTTGAMKTNAGTTDSSTGYRSRYTDEAASAGYYKAFLSDYGITTELTAAPHSGILRFTFPENGSSRIQIDLARRVGGTSTRQYVRVVDANTIEGWMHCPPEGGGWGNGEGRADYRVYFHAQFSKPFTDFGVWEAEIPEDWTRKLEDIESERYQEAVANAVRHDQVREFDGRHIGFFSAFETGKDEQVLLKAGISFVDLEGARKNLAAEIPDWDFDAVHRSARRLWNEALSRVQIQGGTENERTIFYTALYHTMIDPRTMADVDGRYPGGDGRIHQHADFEKRTVFSGWDVFRSQFPLQTIINPRLVNDMLNSLITLAEETGNNYFERWEFMNAYSGCMIGNPAVSVLADAYAKGIRGYNVEQAYRIALNTCERYGNGDRGYAVVCEPDPSAGKGYGYSPFAISNTLEFAYAEWCLAQLADALGHTGDAAKYRKRAQSYRNVFDAEKGWFRPKDEQGNWLPWPAGGRLEHWYGTVESNPYQQGWFVPHDVAGMVELMGGTDRVVADLTDFFEQSPDDLSWNDYYNHANEPVHHVPFLFNRLGKPWLTQKWTREICERAYHNSVEGLVGNEDVGQMSAWYVLAASGIHPIAPGDARYEITSPVFERIAFKLDSDFASGNVFTIVAKNNTPGNRYIQSATLNGEPHPYCFIDHHQLAAGGVLELTMGDQPNENWGLDR